MSMVEKIARAIARENGDEFADAFKNKDRWVAKRGMSGGRFRDVNEPFQSDYLDMAKAAISALETPTPEMKMAGAQAITVDHMQKSANYDAACDAWSAMIRAAKEG